MSRSPRALVSLALVGALLLAGCSDDADPSADRPTTTATPEAEGSAKLTARQVLGEASVEVGDRSWDFDVTACVVGKDRITAQGDDRSGATVVASFAIESKAGSLTVSQGQDAWAIGPAGGTEVEDGKVSGDGLSGRGGFTKRTFDDEERGPEVAGKPTDGSFELTCHPSDG